MHIVQLVDRVGQAVYSQYKHTSVAIAITLKRVPDMNFSLGSICVLRAGEKLIQFAAVCLAFAAASCCYCRFLSIVAMYWLGSIRRRFSASLFYFVQFSSCRALTTCTCAAVL